MEYISFKFSIKRQLVFYSIFFLIIFFIPILTGPVAIKVMNSAVLILGIASLVFLLPWEQKRNLVTVSKDSQAVMFQNITFKPSDIVLATIKSTILVTVVVLETSSGKKMKFAISGIMGTVSSADLIVLGNLIKYSNSPDVTSDLHIGKQPVLASLTEVYNKRIAQGK